MAKKQTIIVFHSHIKVMCLAAAAAAATIVNVIIIV